MVQVDGLAIGQVVVIGRRVVGSARAVILKKHAAVRNIGIVLMVRKLQAEAVVLVQRDTGLEHQIGHFVVAIKPTIAACVGSNQSAEGIARLVAAAGFQGGFACIPGPDAR